MRRWLLALALLTSPAAAQRSVQGLDHIPIAVRDLERAKADFEALGFVLKPGRAHANGLRNTDAKFRDGTELELITANAATDALSRRYVDWLEQGEGPVLLGLYAPEGTPPPIDGMFYDRRQRSPTDRPGHFAHRNGARTLAAARVAGLDAWPGAVAGARCSPFGTALGTSRLPEGEIVFLPASARRLGGRPIIGATVAVESLDTARRFVSRPYDGCKDGLWSRPTACGWSSAPTEARSGRSSHNRPTSLARRGPVGRIARDRA
jgi:hypothetical protein